MQSLANNTETTPTSAGRSAAAERMRRHRERRRDGLRCLMIELRETEVNALIQRGYLNDETRNDLGAIRFMHSSTTRWTKLRLPVQLRHANRFR
jgi:hypothetical protein